MYRLMYRNDNGSVVYKSIDHTGSEMLTVFPDGSMSSHFIGGMCSDCAFSVEACDWPDCPIGNGGNPGAQLPPPCG
jgi:hypothetical protein